MISGLAGQAFQITNILIALIWTIYTASQCRLWMSTVKVGDKEKRSEALPLIANASPVKPVSRPLQQRLDPRPNPSTLFHSDSDSDSSDEIAVPVSSPSPIVTSTSALSPFSSHPVIIKSVPVTKFLSPSPPFSSADPVLVKSAPVPNSASPPFSAVDSSLPQATDPALHPQSEITTRPPSYTKFIDEQAHLTPNDSLPHQFNPIEHLHHVPVHMFILFFVL